ncbi:MAG: hypothetical protein RBT52_01955 [Sulfurimonas sp.]|jgi:hypothetical protein|nr:hypothetical protein [Sulfurimonas sp.]
MRNLLILLAFIFIILGLAKHKEETNTCIAKPEEKVTMYWQGDKLICDKEVILKPKHGNDLKDWKKFM